MVKPVDNADPAREIDLAGLNRDRDGRQNPDSVDLCPIRPPPKLPFSPAQPDYAN